MTSQQLYEAPERLALRLLDQLLEASVIALEHEHATIAAAYEPDDPPTLIGARMLTARIRELRPLLRWYDAAVLDALGRQRSLPF